jgi:hypothetical protein
LSYRRAFIRGVSVIIALVMMVIMMIVSVK